MKILPKILTLTALFVLGFSLAPRLASAFTCHAVAGGGNWNSASTWENCNSTIPQAADDVVLDASSGSVAVNAATNNLNSFDMTGYAGTLSGSSNITVAPSSGSTVAKFDGTISWTGTLNLNPTVTATTTLTTNGKTLGAITVAAASGAHAVFADGVTTGSGNTVTLTSGYLHMDGASDNSGLTHSWGIFSSNNTSVRKLYLGNSTITIASASTSWNVGQTTNLTLVAGTPTIRFTSATAAPNFGNVALDYNNTTVEYTGATTATLSGSPTLRNLTITGTSGIKTAVFNIGATPTISNTLTVDGNSSVNRIQFRSDTLGTTRTITVNGTVSASNADFRDITGAGSASWDLSGATGGSGDALGNSGITFTPAQTNYWVGDGGSWSDSTHWASTSGGTGGTGRVPLPQDDVYVDSAFTSGQVVTGDMARLGKNVDWSGASWTGTPVRWTLTSGLTPSIYGSLTFASGMGFTHATGGFTFEGRSTHTLMTQNVAFGPFTVSVFGGTLTLLDAYNGNISSSGSIAVTNGTFNANNFNVTGGSFTSTGSATRSVMMGNGTWTLGGATTVWNLTSTGMTLVPGNSTILVTYSIFSTTNKPFVGAGLTYNNLTILGGGSGVTTISGSNTFNTLTIGAPKTITFTSGTTQRINRFVALGTSSNTITLNASTGGSVATLSMPGANTFVGDYLAITDVNATGGAKWYAGANSTLSNSTGWLLQAGPQRRGSFIQDAKVRLERGKMIINAR